MSVLTSRPTLRWLVPATAAVVLVGGGAAIGTLAAEAEPSLPARSAAQLLVDLQTSRLEGLSGTVVQRADLGLPPLAELAGRAVPEAADLATMLTGTHTLRVWHSGPDKQRVSLMDTLGERDLIRNGTDLWVWNSKTRTGSHQKLPSEGPEVGATELPVTPQQAAERALAAVDPSTEVSVGRSATVAGRDAYELVLDPRDQASLVHQVRVAIDAKEHVPLRFEVFSGDGERPAFELAFTQVDFKRPDDAQFAFNPPPGAKVTEEPARAAGDRGGSKNGPGAADRPKGEPGAPTAVGSGWTTVLTARLGTEKAAPAGRTGKTDGPRAGAPAELAGVLDGLPKVSGDWGSGRLFSTRLLNVLLTDDGRVLAGAVTPERLYEVARR